MSEIIIQKDIARRYFIETWGCQMNLHDSEKLSGSLHRLGYAPTDSESTADVVILNTCSVREKAQEKVYARLQRFSQIKRTRPLVIGVAGCVAQQEGEAIFARAPDVDFVLGTQSLVLLPNVLKRVQNRERRVVEIDRHAENLDIPPEQVERVPGVKAYITIMEGCDNFCTFCIVPFTRGRERCRSTADIVNEAKSLQESGFREIQLLGQNVNSYRDPRDGRSFAALIDAVHEVEGIERIRFTSPHPKDFDDALMKRFRDSAKLCPHMHLPAQSGSTTVLERMRRGYSREELVDRVDRARELVPDIALSTDLIVGFPGETDPEFRDTLSLLERVEFDSLYSFKYSERPMTFAAREQADDVPERVKGERLAELQALQKAIQLKKNETRLGVTEEVLVEGPSRKGGGQLTGRSPHNRVVNFDGPADIVGSFVQVRISRAGPNSLTGALLKV